MKFPQHAIDDAVKATTHPNDGRFGSGRMHEKIARKAIEQLETSLEGYRLMRISQKLGPYKR